MEAKARAVVLLLALVALALLTCYKLLFGMDWLSFLYAAFIIVVAFAVLDFFLGG